MWVGVREPGNHTNNSHEDFRNICSHSEENGFPSQNSPARSFHCAACQTLVFICLSCDRGNIYCPGCAPIQKEKRIRAARLAYRQSLQGKLVRAAGHQRARKRALKNSEGDHGSILAYQKVTASVESSQTEHHKRENEFEDKEKSEERENAEKDSSQNQKQILCSFCGSRCAAFFRSGDKPWAREKKFWNGHRKRIPGFRRGFTWLLKKTPRWRGYMSTKSGP